jgi:hypothetical protein
MRPKLVWRVEDGRQFGDLLEFVDFRYLARVTRVVGSSVSALARARATRGSSARTCRKDTELRRDANRDPDVAGYEIVWRDSAEPLWTESRRVGNVTAGTIEGLNKDDWSACARSTATATRARSRIRCPPTSSPRSN